MGIETIYVIDDDPLLRDFMNEALRRKGFTPRLFANGKEALAAMKHDAPDLVFSDLIMPEVDGMEVLSRAAKLSPQSTIVIMTAYGTIESAVEAMKAGAHDYLLKPFSPDQLEVALIKAEEQKRLKTENDFLRSELDSRDSRAVVIGNDPSMQRMYENVRRVARSKATVLLHGETGTGKEIVARMIHQSSPRCDRPMVKVNCAALSENLLESELFGHERGAFTGATERKLGRFELAHGGTLLLDEVSEMPVGLQAKLLRVLELEEFERVGGTRTLNVDVRVISATNRNLHDEIRKGKFREDLFFRLNVVPIHLPALRERPMDVPELAHSFLEEFCEKAGEMKKIEPAGIKLLQSYRWPGNVRELRNLVHRMVVMEPSSDITADCIRGELLSRRALGIDDAPCPVVGTSIGDMERDLILSTLEHTSGNKEEAARILKVSSRTLRNKLLRYGQAQLVGA
ncbi:MAG: sigma-54-dependent Fis family transcriptional regulator [Planctomycetes bacterium]|nr:sigma-54-dependent Fis family transcriptional regulator [Planctomycetota bacterium]